MNEDEAKQKLSEIMDHYRPGTVLHFLGDLLAERSEQVAETDPDRHEQLRQAEAALIVVGSGIDTILPW